MTYSLPMQYGKFGLRRCKCRLCQRFGYHRSGGLVRMLAPRDIGSFPSGAPCKCGRSRSFWWDAGNERCDSCGFDPLLCCCTPILALQLGKVS